MSTYKAIEETIVTDEVIGELPKEKIETAPQIEELPETARRAPSVPVLVAASVALSTAATAATILVRRRVIQRRKARGIFAVTRRISFLSPKLFVMFPLSAYVVDRGEARKQFRAMTKRLRALDRRRERMISQGLGQFNALRERIPVGK